MAKSTMRPPKRLADLVGRIIDPVAAKRGFASADLFSAWPEIVGARFADSTRPERLSWPQRDPDMPGVLVLRVDGPVSVLIQHELDQIIERINAFMGYRAVGRIRLVQGPVAGSGDRDTSDRASLEEEAEARLDLTLEDMDDERLRSALRELGRGVLAQSR